jgi:Rieske Fe-S protein
MATFKDCRRRRAILRAGIGLGVSAYFSSRAAAQDDPAAARPRTGDLLVQAGDARNTALTPADVTAGNRQIIAWAMDPTDGIVRNGSRLNGILVLRLDPDRLSSATRERAVAGIVAYSAICPHNGCDVTEWLAAEQSLYCPCHASKFEPSDAGRVLAGPAPSALPALPLKLLEGKLMVAQPFSARITFEQG